ncbi:MAG: ribosomal protein S18-alanine N-acetyltransferase [Armatimonadetes bacterium]|nr:ribosomal protein S18-alanine N-acetyltransferase [Armatimonadota bacterium]
MAKESLGFIRFEPIKLEHIPRVLEIEKVSNGSPWSERAFQNEINHENGIFLVAFAGDRIVGFAGVWLVIDEAHITTIAVAPDARGHGVGRALMIEVLTRSREKGMLCSTLEVRAGNKAAIALYESLGYKTISTRKAYYPDNKEDALVMWLYELEKWTPA